MNKQSLLLARRLSGFLLLLAVFLSLTPGPAAAGVAFFESKTQKLLRKYNIPGASLAIMKEGRLVMARGFGYADKARKVRAKPDTVFRIASVSKAITAVAVLRLVQEGKLDLDAPAFSILDDLAPFPGHSADPRLARITVRDLLRHSGGWDSTKSGDPQFSLLDIARETGLPSPVDARTLIRYWMGKPLDVEPGKQHLYSNFGYNLLGRIIEKVSGQTYEDYVNSALLLPSGIRGMQIGKSLREQRADREATYYAQPGAGLFDSVFPSLGKVPQAYGSWSHPVLDAHGGWIATAPDLLRFVRGLEGSGGRQALLSPSTLRQMTAFQGLEGQSPSRYYALGWDIRDPGTAQESWSHAGALENSNAALLRRGANGISFAVIFNSLPTDFPRFFDELDQMMTEGLRGIDRWPNRDLFARY